MSDDLIAQLRICANRGPGPFWADSAKRLMRWAANALEAAEPAMRAEYERGRSEREQAAEPSPTIAHSSLAQKLWAESPVTERQGGQAAEPVAWPKINLDDDSYNHIPLKPAFTVQATYKLIGKLKPLKREPLTEGRGET